MHNASIEAQPGVERELHHASKRLQALRFRVPGVELKTPSPETRKKYKKLRSSLPRVGPRKYEKKIQKKNTKTAIFGPLLFFFFCFFLRIFGAQPGAGNSVFFRSFRISGLEGFVSSIPGTRNRNSSLVLSNLMTVAKNYRT